MEDPKEKESTNDDICGVVPNNCEDFLKELASECGEDPIKLKERIIFEIEEEESQSTLCTTDPQTASNGNETKNIPHKDGENSDSDEYIETEQKFRDELIDLERRLKIEEEKRMLENKVTKERHLKLYKEEEERRMRRHRFFEEELKKIEQANTFYQHISLEENNCQINGKISLELSKQQELIVGLQKHVVEERQAFEEAQAEQRRKTEETRCRAATKIQASVRAFLVRTKNAMTRSEKQEEWRQMREVHLRLEKERKERQEKLRKKLEEQRIKQEEERMRKEEERIRQKEERMRKEEERMRKEEERIRQKEERRREEEERIRQKEERRREEEERIRQEEEKKREEEERRKKEEEDRREHERRCVAQERAKEKEARLERKRKQKLEKARKKKEEEIQKQEELERKKRIEEEESQQREMEERKAEELRKQEEEEKRRQQELERHRMEESQNQKEKQIQEKKQNPHCSYGESEKEVIYASNPQSTSEELAQAKMAEIDDAMSETDQSEEERCARRLKHSSSPDEILTGTSSGDATEAGEQQGERLTFLRSDKAVIEECESQASPIPTWLSDSNEQKRLEWVKDFAPWAKQNKRKPVLRSTVVRKGSGESGPALGTDSIIQSALWNSSSEEQSVCLLAHSEDEGKAKQRGPAEELETTASVRAFLVCKRTVAVQEERKEEWRKKKEQQLQMEKERKEKEESVRKKAEEQRRMVEEEEERAHLERERRMEEEVEEKEQSEMEDRKGEELREQEERESRRKEESQKQREEPITRVKRNPCHSAVQGEKEPQATYEELSQAKKQGSKGDIREAGTEQSEGEGLRHPADKLSSSGLMCLPDCTEQKRLAWMKDCVPWIKLSLQNKRKPVVKSKTVRRGSVKVLPPLSTDAILQCTAWNSLKQVTTVMLEDLPGCSLSTLSECARLQALTMRRCGLVALDGLSGCKGLRYIDLQENAIRFVNCQDLTKLQVLLLSQNQLTSIHGLEDAVNLDVLELSHNRISRIGGLESLKRLQRLLLDHNQLISTKGLSEIYTILYLDCGYNHLTSMGNLENCALLNTLNLQGNNLTEPPSLKNHVLMRELRLDDNIISSLDSLSACWLPLLQLISASKNSITRLPPLSDCVSLQKLDISYNCLSELANVCQSLEGCSQLQEIQLLGNPFQQEGNWRASLLQTVPDLRSINGEWIGSTAPLAGRAGSPPPGSFLGFCRVQLQQLEKVRRRHETQLSSTPCPLDVPAVITRHCDELLQLAEEQRYAHEFGELMVTDRVELDTPGSRPDQDTVPATAVEENNQDTASSAPCGQEVGEDSRISDRVLEPSAGTGGENAGSENAGVTNNCCTNPKAKERPAPAKPAKKCIQKLDLKNMAAVVIQSFWRGHVCRRDALLHVTRRAAGGDGSGSSVTAGTCLDQCRAATVIQAVWKGYVLRKRLASALAAVRITETDEEFAEVDMDEFAFDEVALDRDWITLNSERSPSKMQPLCDQPLWPKPPAHQSMQQTSPSALPWHPKQAWPGGESETTAQSACHSISPERIELTHRAKSPSACGFDPPTERSDKIMKEWGLRDRFTAQLMLKRAQKMKPKKKKDRKSGDPAVCLDLFRNNENKQTPVKVPKRNLPEKIQPFKAGEEEFDEQKRREWTNLWLQTQFNNTETDRSSPTIESHHFLPEIDHDILNGRRVQLVSVSALPRCCQAGPGHRDGPDQESESRASAAALSPPRKEHNQMRGDTVGHTKKEAPVPVQAASGPSKKERISFRDNPVQLSQGWGGGKKRSKMNK
ncbi:hypothetical protein AAFF_G00029670 [Aldrovandia affinis]|uniref:Leucine-rich repeat and IQ domain-containing protein 1 n=1 Tax=Aldrovandia affinis TaxID=143900 RepID=A0AAD7WGH1_9TELE|nr:hypothetical protein AAFF_G00029670 [Aldrovandia affinis]